jgi:hypothetical protein
MVLRVGGGRRGDHDTRRTDIHDASRLRPHCRNARGGNAHNDRLAAARRVRPLPSAIPTRCAPPRLPAGSIADT